MARRSVGILLFDEVEVLDFSGPFEVFSVTSALNENLLFKVHTVSKTGETIHAVNNLSVNPSQSFKSCPPLDILIIPGGFGTRRLLEDEETLNWISEVNEDTELTLSVCSGALLLAKLGLLDNQNFCTHQSVYEAMETLFPETIPQKQLRFVQADKYFTSGGISAGLDLSFHIIEMLHGTKIANNTAYHMEYKRNNQKFSRSELEDFRP